MQLRFFINSENQLNSAHLSTTVKDKQSLCWRAVCTSRAQRHPLKTFPVSGFGSGFRIPCFPYALAPCHSLTLRHIRLTQSPMFNFGESYIKWVSLFSVGRGVRQGEPLSPCLFIFTLEILLTVIKQNQDIKGIVVEDKEINCVVFADDLTNILPDKVSYDSVSY